MLKSISSNWGRVIINFAVVFFLTPYLLRTLGLGGNGVWEIINNTAGFLSLLLLGVPMASLKFLSEHVAKKDHAALNTAIASSFGLYVLLGALALVASIPLFGFYEVSQNVPPEWVVQGRWGFFLVALFVALGFVTQLPYGIMIAHHDFALSNAIMSGGLVVRLVATIAVLDRWPTLPALALVHLLVLLAEYAVAVVILKRKYPEVRFGLRGFDRAAVRRIFTFSVFVLLLNVGYQLCFRTGALIVGGAMAADDVAYFKNGLMFMIYLAEVVIAIGQVVMPTATRLRVRNEEQALRDLVLRWSKIALSLILPPSLFLLVLGPEFLVWWTGEPGFYIPGGRTVMIVTAAFLLFLPVRGVALPLLLGLGEARRPAMALVVTGLLSIGLGLLLVGPFGVAGPAFGVALSTFLFALYVLRLLRRETGLATRDWFAYVTVRAAAGALPVAAVLLAVKWSYSSLTASLSGVVPNPRWQGFIVLFVAGLLMLALYALIWVFFVYRDDPYVDVRKRLQAKFGQLRKRVAGGTP